MTFSSVRIQIYFWCIVLIAYGDFCQERKRNQDYLWENEKHYRDTLSAGPKSCGST